MQRSSGFRRGGRLHRRQHPCVTHSSGLSQVIHDAVLDKTQEAWENVVAGGCGDSVRECVAHRLLAGLFAGDFHVERLRGRQAAPSPTAWTHLACYASPNPVYASQNQRGYCVLCAQRQCST